MIRHLCAVLALGLLTSFAAADALVTVVIPFSDNAGTSSSSFVSPPAPGFTSLISGRGGGGISGRNQPVLFAQSSLDVFFTIFAPHAYNFEGSVFAQAEVGTAAAMLAFGIPASTPIEGPFSPSNGGILFNESGVIGPGTYLISARSGAAGELTNRRLFDGSAEAGFAYRLALRELPGRVPEPASLALLGMGGFAVWLRRRRRNQ